MNSFLYFLVAVILLVGLLLIGGYIGKGNMQRNYSTTSNMAKLIGGSATDDGSGRGKRGGCRSCKWY